MDVSRMPKEGDRFGNWVIERTLDRGGMGMVYQAYNPDLGKSEKVALKVLDPAVAEKSADFVKRFYQEAAIVFKTHCPNLVSIHDAGRDAASGFYYIVMEFLGGGTLRDRMRKQGPMPWREALSIIRSVALALAAVAKRKSVHRDIKPENIMFTADGVVKLADFGIAKAAQEDPENMLKTMPAQVFGTPAYMSPEQVKDASSVDARADIWSLGVVLFEMLAGVRPYSSKNLVEVAAFLLSAKPFPDIRTFNAPAVNADRSQPTAVTLKTLPTVAPQATGVGESAERPASRETSLDVPEGVANLLLRMCDKDIDRRIATGEDVVVAIDELLGPSVPIEATLSPGPVPVSAQPRERLQGPDDRPQTSRRRLLAGAAAVLFGVVVVLCAFVVLQRRAAETGRKASADLPSVPTPTTAVSEPSSGDSPETNAVVADVVSPAPAKPQSAVAAVQPSAVRNPESPRQSPKPTSKNVLFQPRGGSIANVLSQLDGFVERRPSHLRVSLAPYAQRKELSLERYEQQLLVPVVERLRSSGVSFSLVSGTGGYGSVVQDVAKRYGCDLDLPAEE